MKGIHDPLNNAKWASTQYKDLLIDKTHVMEHFSKNKKTREMLSVWMRKMLSKRTRSITNIIN